MLPTMKEQKRVELIERVFRGEIATTAASRSNAVFRHLMSGGFLSSPFFQSSQQFLRLGEGSTIGIAGSGTGEILV